MNNLKSWGNYPIIKNREYSFSSEEELKSILAKEKSFIAYGNGRSYGDSALNKNVVFCEKFNYFIGFNESDGILKCQTGVLLKDIIEVFVPKGWFLSVTPGTKYITVAGAIASDVHGKNHHKDGCFSNFLEELKYLRDAFNLDERIKYLEKYYLTDSIEENEVTKTIFPNKVFN